MRDGTKLLKRGLKLERKVSGLHMGNVNHRKQHAANLRKRKAIWGSKGLRNTLKA